MSFIGFTLLSGRNALHNRDKSSGTLTDPGTQGVNLKARWKLPLMKFGFKIVHRLGHYHQAVDALFQLPEAEISNPSSDEDVNDDKPTYCVMGQE